MRKTLVLILALILALTLAACGGNSSSGNGNTNSGSNEGDFSDALENLDDILGSLPESVWPADLVPELPEYPYGKITGYSGPDAYNEVIIKAGETGVDDLDNYLQTLEDGGWTVGISGSQYDTDYAWAAKGTYKVYFHLQADTYVQIDVTIAQAGNWPSFSEYPINAPAPEGYEIVDVDVRFYPDDVELGTSRVGEFTFTCMDMDDEAAYEYCQLLQDEGYFEPFEWQGKEYCCVTSEDYNQSDDAGNIYFYFEMYLADR